jgi:DNA-binding transcriptional LysR family regulator
MRSGHDLCRKKLSLNTFLDAPHVAVAAVEFSADPVDTWLQELGRTRFVVATVPHYIDALHLVAQSELIAVVPQRLVQAYASVLNLVTKKVPLDVGYFRRVSPPFGTHPRRYRMFLASRVDQKTLFWRQKSRPSGWRYRVTSVSSPTREVIHLDV